ncbi:hypothetical protein BDN72DRAFT_196191 [Pluteus cervinus]|uniref:Uncharacterized protein n=1 Tax=Pluteus cervinus TaxID=181527 RepID=A0ACD3AJA2_9AGAR|nr:hypothetical protein BDN72DRAFT_196191 [Pluteus cervinus]
MLFSAFFLPALSAAAGVSATVLPRGPVRLAIEPSCGVLGGQLGNANSGLGPLSSYKTIVSLGDAYSDAGVHDGSSPQPPTLSPPSPFAGGRPSNGKVWVEYLAEKSGAALKGYAVNGAVVDVNQWPKANLPAVNDFVHQVYSVPGQLNPDTTLYVVFFGIGDFVASNGAAPLADVANNTLYNLLVLSSSPVFAKHILVVDNYGRGQKTAEGEEYKKRLFAGLSSLNQIFKSKVGFVDLSQLWGAVLDSCTSFGFSTAGSCLSSSTTTAGACANPDTAFYWLPGTPSTATHQLMADYVESALIKCAA